MQWPSQRALFIRSKRKQQGCATYQIQIVNTPSLVFVVGHLQDMLLSVVIVPQLGCDEQLIALDETLLQGTAHTLASLGRVLVVV